MDLFALTGNTLKVYLGLVAVRETREVCVLSHSALSRKVRLSRHTVLQALRHLERGGWIQGETGRWHATKAPLVDLLGLPEASPMDPLDTERTEEGAEIAQVDSTGGPKLHSSADPPPSKIAQSGSGGPKLHSSADPPPSKIAQVDSTGGPKLHSSTHPSTRTRTLWSSSSEEDSICTAVPPSSSSSSSLLPSSGEGRGEEGGVGGENCGEETKETKSPSNPGGENRGEEEERKTPPRDYLSEMQSWWATIAPEDPEDPRPWFTQLWTEFGTEIPLQVFREFVAAGRRREELKYPDRYQRYFHTCCRNAQSPVSDTEADYANYEARMRAAYLADDAREEEAFENWEEKLRAAYLADDAREEEAFENWEEKLRAGYLADDAREAAAFENGEAKLKAGYLADDARTAADFQARLGSLLAARGAAHTGDPDHVLAPFRAERRRS